MGFDPQGNVLNKLDSSQNVTAGRLLDAWGQGVETTLPRNIDPWGYNAKWGYYYDRETQLYLCQHRMYDASTGRWLNRDPIGLAGGMNLYGYCASGPVGATDPWGLRQTGTYWGDVGQVFVGYWNFISGSAQQLVDPYWGHKAARSFLADPGKFLSKAAQSLSFWDTDDPAEFGERFAPYIPMIAGMCELTSSRMSSTASTATAEETVSVTSSEVTFTHRAGAPRSTINYQANRSQYLNPSREWSPENMARMRRGRNPLDGHGRPYEWSHVGTPYRNGGDFMQLMTHEEHMAYHRIQAAL